MNSKQAVAVTIAIAALALQLTSKKEESVTKTIERVKPKLVEKNQYADIDARFEKKAKEVMADTVWLQKQSEARFYPRKLFVSKEKATQTAIQILKQNDANFAKSLSWSTYEVSYQESFSGKVTKSSEYIQLQQKVDGIPIANQSLSVMLQNFQGQTAIRSVEANFKADPEDFPSADSANLNSEQAERLAREASNAEDNMLWHQEPKFYDNYKGKTRLLTSFEFQGIHNKAFVDLHSKEVFLEDNRHAATAQITGFGIFGDYHQEREALDQLPMPFIQVQLGEEVLVADQDGNLDLPDELSGEELSVQLVSEQIKIRSIGTSDLEIAIDEATDLSKALVVNPRMTRSTALSQIAQVNAFYHSHRLAGFFRSLGLDVLRQMNYQMPINVNIQQNAQGERMDCNAFYSSGTLNFFRESSRCINTAVNKVIYHEFGHFMDDVFGGIKRNNAGRGLSEGWGDVLAIMLTRESNLTRIAFDPAAGSRDANNEFQYPTSTRGLLNTPIHTLGTALSGFSWRLYKGLEEKLGNEEQAYARMVELVIPSLFSNAQTIPQVIRESLLRDDDDSDPSNGTPNQDVILQAALAHSLGSYLSLPQPANLNDLP